MKGRPPCSLQVLLATMLRRLRVEPGSTLPPLWVARSPLLFASPILFFLIPVWSKEKEPSLGWLKGASQLETIVFTLNTGGNSVNVLFIQCWKSNQSSLYPAMLRVRTYTSPCWQPDMAILLLGDAWAFAHGDLRCAIQIHPVISWLLETSNISAI